MTSQGLSIGTPIFRSSIGTLSSSSGVSLARDSAGDYPEIGTSVCWNLVIEVHHINMVALAGAPSQNSSSIYPTIRGSEASDAWTPSDRLVWNLNPDFNIVLLQTIMELIQCMVLEGSPLIALAQQGTKAAGQVIAAERSTSNCRNEPSIGNRSDNQAKRAQSEEASSASGNICLADNDAHQRITQNHRQREYGDDRDDLHNIIDDRRHLRARSQTPPRHSPV
jgi:hypothetical protein